MLLLVMSLGLVALLMGKAADPDTWRRLGFDSRPKSADSAANSDMPPESPTEYDTRVRPLSRPPLPIDTFIIGDGDMEKDEAEPPQADGDFPGLIHRYLSDVRDHTPFRRTEQDAWFHLLDVLREADAEQLEQRSLGNVGFVQLFEQPETYRGKVVTTRGLVKRNFDVHPGRNDRGFDQQIHQLWLFPEGGPRSPIVVYSLDVPPGFPSSRLKDDEFRNIAERVEVTGFFFKNWAYPAGKQILTAPLIVAKQIDWQPAPDLSEPSRSPNYWYRFVLIVVAVGAAISVAGVLWIQWAMRNWALPKRLSPSDTTATLRKLESEPVEPSDFESLANLDREDPSVSDEDGSGGEAPDR